MKQTLTVIAILAISTLLTSIMLNANYGDYTLATTCTIIMYVMYIIIALSLIASINAKFIGHAITFLVILVAIPLMFDFGDMILSWVHLAEPNTTLEEILSSKYDGYFLSQFGIEGRIITCLIIPVTIFAVSFFIPPIFVRKRTASEQQAVRSIA